MFNMDPQKLRSFYDLVKEKLLDPPWKINVYNITTWKVRTNSIVQPRGGCHVFQ